ncbi:MAG: hypothetical protein WCX97_01450 [Candidatus Magasanikbacteria bacterium]
MKKLLQNIIGQRLVMLLITVFAVIFCPMPSFEDLAGWKDVERWRRITSAEDACLGKYAWRPIFAWNFSRKFGKKWGEYIAQSQSPFAVITGLFRTMCGLPPKF